MTQLQKIRISNYRAFEHFELEFNAGLNTIVGDNDVGKSTLLEAISLALTGRLRGRPISTELSPHLFNNQASQRYVARLRAGESPRPPEIIIDLYLASSPETASLRGTNNGTMEDCCGLRIRAAFNESFDAEYRAFIADPDSVKLIPTEYYRVEWLSFAGNAISGRGVAITVSLIDASAIRLSGGADYYLQQIINSALEPAERVELARAYRSLREGFSAQTAIAEINEKLQASHSDVTDKSFSLGIDISSKAAWESSLVPHLDDLPLQFVGKGDQNTLKILLALNRRVDSSHVVLVEEPENHLSPGSLNALVRKIAEKCSGKQVFITTHSSYVLNKLGLEALILLGRSTSLRLDALAPDTQDYFKKLSGYDTLRIVLAKRAILVEGPSDELAVQRAYRDVHNGRMPLEDGVEVINVRGLSFKRFLDIAVPLRKDVRVVTDNDGKAPNVVRDGYKGYTASGLVTICTGELNDGRTLEPQVISSMGRGKLNAILGTDFATDGELEHYMLANKTTWALRVFESDPSTKLKLPSYIEQAVA